MTETEIWRPLQAELDRWQQRGERAVFWLRDDDAVEPSVALDHLLDLTGRFAIPVTLAVIPEKTDAPLARCLDQSPQALVAVHGWSHENHAGIGEKKQELGRHRDSDIVLEEIRSGVQRLSRLHGERFVAMLVPPWNRIDAALLPHLGGVGISALSVFGPEQPGSVRSVNTHVDLIDWKSTRGGRSPAVLIGEIVGRLRAIEGADATVGILTHHLVHDENARSFLQRLFDLTCTHPACHWAPVSEILASV